MAKNIEPKLRKIGSYLQLEEDTIFVIPEYQRPYSWGITNCDKLWQDIIDYNDGDSKDNYFFGTIIINCDNDDTIYSLIDGQQRTTTFLLLLKALLIRINIAINNTANDEDSKPLFRGLKDRRRRIMELLYKVEADDIPEEFDKVADIVICQRKCILENRSINELYKNELSIILGAVDFTEAEKNVIKLPRKQKDNKYTNFFRNFKFFYKKAELLSDSQLNSIAKTITEKCEVIEIKSWQVGQAITMFNSLNSDGLPLCDADIISAKLYANAETNNQRDEFNKRWKELTELIDELNQNGIASFDSILNQQMYYQRAKNKEILSDTGAIIVTTPGVRRYYTEINKELLEKPLELCSSMINLAKIWKKVFDYPIMQVLSKFNENFKLFLASYFLRFNPDEITEEKIHSIVVCMLRLFAVLEIVDTGYSSNSFKTFLFGEIIKLVDTDVPEREIMEDFDKHIRSKWNAADIIQELFEYDRNTLVYLNEYLYSVECGVNFEFSIKYDIEHIMPASGANLQTIRADAKIDTEDEFVAVVNKLGNKILLEEKINRSIGNEWFSTKVSTRLHQKTGYIDSIYPIAKSLVKQYQTAQKPYWTKDDINNATQIASNRIADFIFATEQN